MTKLYVCEISNLIEEIKADENAIQSYFDKLGKTRIEHILKNNRAEDRARALGASLLLLFALGKEGCELECLPDFAFTAKGKPYIKAYGHLHFNLSHTKNIITCVISDAEVGVDVEHIREIKEATVNRVFSENEKKMAEYKQEGYVRLWTMKEAYAKLIGNGLSDILEGIEIVENEKGKCIKKLNQDIRKTSCYMVVAEGKLSDAFDYPYYYSVCSSRDNVNMNSYSQVPVLKYQWDNGHFIEYI